MKTFVGIFAELLTNFVKFKQSLGFKYETEAGELYRFSVFTTTFSLSKPILTKEIVQAWCTQRVHEGVRHSHRRAYPVRQFAVYLNSMGLDAYIIPPGANTRHYTYIPYIFTHAEIERIFINSDRLCPRRNSTISFVVPVILRILYSCGLRISEAISLQNKHVNLRDGILEVKNSKFGKDRLVPITESMTEICRQYFRVLHQYSSPDDYFFMKSNGQPVTRDNVYRRFREILWVSGISHRGRGTGPRLHDLRHTYAVHTLKRAVDRGIDVYCTLPILSTYMGHVSVTASEQYLRLTADAFPAISCRG
ncbi:tyrosine-type recombinase/integrase [Desulfobulbus alkaliphilus]|uniref:tyrosine-type recombinase/integrase n=1 Tax=Desulfobulbus alkaliphilus TaxID=869814 RepID=UPI0019658E2C|nr:tyrosine-type recombinase/integrase [Desulfobulbus alkaliphilus]MBM9536915.1 tyrosine-type recombinase/integrase [Desulfobulbus alkaliphilus]